MWSLIIFIFFIIITVSKINSAIKIKEDAFPQLKSVSAKIGTIFAELFFMYISWYIINYIISNI